MLSQSVEEIQRVIIETCTELYGEPHSEKYFIVKNDTAYNVRSKIFESIKNKDLIKEAYLDMSVYILQSGNDVFIDVV